VGIKSSKKINFDEGIKEFPKEESGSNKITGIALTIVFLIVASMAIGYLWFYPEKRHQAQQWFVSIAPFANKILPIADNQTNSDTAKINFIDVRQRFIKNTPLGKDMRVIEGIFRNNTAEGMSGVKLYAELYDSESSLLLTSKTSLGGNILTDDKLENLEEDKIFSALSLAQTSNLADAMIPPNGQMPFMIVLTREPVGVVKLVIVPVLE